MYSDNSRTESSFNYGTFFPLRGKASSPTVLLYKLCRHPLGVQRRILGNVIVNVAQLRLGMGRPPHHDWISRSTWSAGVVLPCLASSCPLRMFSST